MERPTITARAAACSLHFEQFVPSDGDIEVKTMGDGLPSGEELRAEDQRTRFNMWTANPGVFASGHSSVEHRLRDHSEIYNLMLQFLDALHANLYYSRTRYVLDDG